MSKNQEIKITVEDGVKELVIRHGDAAPVELPNGISIEGDIFSPGNFAEARKGQIEAKTAMVVVSAKDFAILLITDEQSDRGYRIQGKLVPNQHITALKVNKESGFDLKELQKTLKFRRTLFPDVMEYTAIMGALQNFQAKSQTEVKAADDRKGNVNNSFQRTSQIEAPLAFSLKLPIFENTEEKTFRIEILVDVRDAGVTFYLESIELADLFESVRKEVFATELERLKDYVIISK